MHSINYCTVCVVDKVLRMYGELNGDLHLVELERGTSSIGLCLAGNRDLAKMSVFVVGYQPGSIAANDGRIRIGDELLEVRWKLELSHLVFTHCTCTFADNYNGLQLSHFLIQCFVQ